MQSSPGRRHFLTTIDVEFDLADSSRAIVGIYFMVQYPGSELASKQSLSLRLTYGCQQRVENSGKSSGKSSGKK